MSESHLLPDDPRLTAYALGELDPTERETFERLLAVSPAAQAALCDIRDLAGLLTAELKQEPAPSLTPAQRTAVLTGKGPCPTQRPQSSVRTSTRWISRFAALAAMAALVAVAAFLPTPGERSGGSLPAVTYLDRESRDLPAVRWDLALQQREGLSEFDYAAEAGEGTVDELGKQISAPESRLATTGVVGGPVARDELGTKLNLPAPTSGSGNNSLRGVVMLSDGSAPVSHEFKSAKKSEAGWELSRSRGKEQASLPRQAGGGQPGSTAAERKGRVPSLQSTEGLLRKGSSQTARSYNETAQTQPASEKDSYRYEKLYARSSKPVDESGQFDQPGDHGLRTKSSGERRLASLGKPGEDSVDRRGGYVNGGGVGGGRGRGADPARPSASVAVSGAAADEKSGEARGYQTFGVADDKQKAGRPESQLAKDLGKRISDLEWAEKGFSTFELAPGTEAYEPIIENLFLSSYEDPLSTFGIDVDTASYANVRRFLTQPQLPPRNAVRIEELVNYFSYDYPPPAGDQPFSVNVETGRCPWNPGNGLVRIGLKGREIDRDKRPASNLVFLVDVSGSMQAENKLPLVKMGLNLLTQQMTESDKVAIVTYSDTAVQRLGSTNGANKQAITGVIDSLQAGGSTNGAGGIQLAYSAAVDNFVPGGTNRVILLTDGDFNVGVSGDDELVKLIQERARTKVFFSVLGFGMGNLKDGKLEKLADKGNGQYAYIDNQREARKVFVEDLAGTLVTIAKDVKIQVEFNPNQVGAYRLIGYENRVMAAQDFNNDAKDAGDIGAGHTVTALYETMPAADSPKPLLGETLRYRNVVVPKEGGLAHELLTVKLRYKLPEADTSTLVEFPVADPKAPVSGAGSPPNPPSPPRISRDFNWAAAVAAFGMILRDSQFRGQANFDMVLELAQGAIGEDKGGHRKEFIELVKAARALRGGPPVEATQAPRPAAPLTREQAEAKASMNGKYQNLLRIVEAPGDADTYGALNDYGHWDGTSYAGQDNLPTGYWVYAAPHWYIWGDMK